MEANTEPTAMVDAKSKLDIFANVLSPKTRVITIIIVNIPNTESINQRMSCSVIIYKVELEGKIKTTLITLLIQLPYKIAQMICSKLLLSTHHEMS